MCHLRLPYIKTTYNSISHSSAFSGITKMAEGKVDENQLVKKFEYFCILAGSEDKTQMTPKASGKMATDCFENAGYKKYDIKTICDTSVFPKLKEEGKP